MTAAPGSGEVEALLAEVLPSWGPAVPLVPVKAFQLQEKLGQPAFSSRGWSPARSFSLDTVWAAELA